MQPCREDTWRWAYTPTSVYLSLSKKSLHVFSIYETQRHSVKGNSYEAFTDTHYVFLPYIYNTPLTVSLYFLYSFVTTSLAYQLSFISFINVSDVGEAAVHFLICL